MVPVLIVVAVVIIAVVVALAVTNPMMRRREDAAIAAVKEQLDTVELIEPRTTAMGTEPKDAGGLRGMACLGLGNAELVAVTWARSATWRIPRPSILSVDAPADPPAGAKATITVTFARPEGGEARAMFRLRDAPAWLDALGYRDGDGEASDPEPDEPEEGDPPADVGRPGGGTAGA
jgi:hypothetical protein